MTIDLKVLDDASVTLCELDSCEDTLSCYYARAELNLVDCSVELNKRVI